MNNWLKVGEVANILNVSKSFLRIIICKEEFKNYITEEKPLLINYCDKFKELIKKYIKKRNIIRNKNKKRILKDETIQCQMKHVVVNENILKGWTQTAIDCYNLGCNCSKCQLKNIIFSECCMKQTVMLLVKKFGKPKKDNFIIEDCE